MRLFIDVEAENVLPGDEGEVGENAIAEVATHVGDGDVAAFTE